MSFRQTGGGGGGGGWGNFTSPPQPQKEPLKIPPRLGLKSFKAPLEKMQKPLCLLRL